MPTPLVTSSHGLTLLGGGDLGTHDLSDALSVAPDLVAADGGAHAALQAGRMPAAVVGDMDSLADSDRIRIPEERLHHVKEQESTDFDKVLERVQGPYALGVGFLGRRIDHELANLNALVRLRHLRCLLLGAHDVIFAAPPTVSIKLTKRSRVSLFPLAPVFGASTGLEWPLQGIDFAPAARHGTSNRMANGETQLSLRFDSPGMLVILPREAMHAAIKGLKSAPLWPAHVREG